MIRRVVHVAQNFDKFMAFPSVTQTHLLKKNADAIVSLQGSVFFQKKKQGMDQILMALGVNDLQCAQNILSATMMNNQVRLNHIDYKALNTLQHKPEGTLAESRYDHLLEQVGITMGINQNLVILFFYILLVSTDTPEGNLASHNDSASAAD